MGKTYSKEELFENMPIPKAVSTLAVPTVMSSLVTVLYSLADTFFVGMINEPIQTAAVTLAAPVLLAFYAINNLFGVGSSSMMSRALGKKDYEAVKESSATGFYGALILSLLFSLICMIFMNTLVSLLGATEETKSATENYLFWTVVLGAAPAILNVVMAYLVRSEGAALHASIGTMSGCILNIILDPIFILPWGLNLKAEGAALATFLSNCFAFCYFMVYVYRKKGNTYVSINPKNVKMNPHIIKGIFEVGIPASIQNLLNVLGSTILNNSAALYGSSALAAMGICSRINMVPMQIAMGISQGIMPLVGYNYASRNIKRMKAGLVYAARISISLLVCSSIFLFFFSENVVRLFIDDAETIAYGAKLLKGFCLGIPFLGMDFVAVGVFQAVGFGKMSLAFAIARKALLEIPMIIVLNKLFPLYGLSYAQLSAEFVLATIAIIVLIRFFRKQEKLVNENI